jgi:hypothetical protein
MSDNNGGCGEAFAGLFVLPLLALVLLFWYGAAVLVFRYAFGIDLPNPIEWLPAEWQKHIPHVPMKTQ